MAKNFKSKMSVKSLHNNVMICERPVLGPRMNAQRPEIELVTYRSQVQCYNLRNASSCCEKYSYVSRKLKRNLLINQWTLTYLSNLITVLHLCTRSLNISCKRCQTAVDRFRNEVIQRSRKRSPQLIFNHTTHLAQSLASPVKGKGKGTQLNNSIQ